MYHALVHFLNFETKLIDQFRKKYDPTIDMIEPHITVLFPVPDKISESFLIEQINNIIQSWRSFPIRIHGLYKSWDHWLFLLLKEGNNLVIKLHDEIYSGLLAKYRRKDIIYIPHIALGLFVENIADYDYKDPNTLNLDIQKYDTAVKEAESLELDFVTNFDKLQLIKVTDDLTQIHKGKEFILNISA